MSSTDGATPDVSQAAINAVTAMVHRAMEAPTRTIMQRLDQLEAALPTPTSSAATPLAPPPPPPIPSHGMQGSGSGNIGGGPQLTTPSGSGSIPPGLAVPGLGTFSQVMAGGARVALGPGSGTIPLGLAVPGLGTVSQAPQVMAGGASAPGLAAPLQGALPAVTELPLSLLLAAAGPHPVTGGVVVGQSSPPVPGKLTEKIWRGEFIDLSALLPFRLSAPEPTLSDALQRRTRDEKQITTIEQWMVCFCSYASVVVLRAPHRMRDLLGYMALISKAAHDFEGTPWLSYDAHFRCLAATLQLQAWATPEQAIWSQYFGRATPRAHTSNALSVGPYTELPSTQTREEARGQRSSSQGQPRRKERGYPYSCPQPICARWNKTQCRAPDCTYRHVCLDCHGPHREPDCPVRQQKKPPFRKEAGHGASEH